MSLSPDETALLAAVLAAPDDDAPRLVFADWLEENGEAERAELIRCQIELTKPPHCGHSRENASVDHFAAKGCKRCDLRLRERRILESHNFFSIGPLCITACVSPSSDNQYSVDQSEATGITDRGFLRSIHIEAKDWFEHADALTAAHPLCEVTLTTWPTVRWLITQHGDLPKALAAEWPSITFHLPRGLRGTLPGGLYARRGR
jgi:uncharacterized protein (TIGR02996 family)